MPALRPTTELCCYGRIPLPRALNQLARVAALVLGLPLIAATTPQNGKAMTNPTPVVRLAELQIDPAQLDAYLALLREEIEASVRLEPGVLTLNAVALKDAPDHIRADGDLRRSGRL